MAAVFNYRSVQSYPTYAPIGLFDSSQWREFAVQASLITNRKLQLKLQQQRALVVHVFVRTRMCIWVDVIIGTVELSRFGVRNNTKCFEKLCVNVF